MTETYITTLVSLVSKIRAAAEAAAAAARVPGEWLLHVGGRDMHYRKGGDIYHARSTEDAKLITMLSPANILGVLDALAEAAFTASAALSGELPAAKRERDAYVACLEAMAVPDMGGVPTCLAQAGVGSCSSEAPCLVSRVRSAIYASIARRERERDGDRGQQHRAAIASAERERDEAKATLEEVVETLGCSFCEPDGARDGVRPVAYGRGDDGDAWVCTDHLTEVSVLFRLDAPAKETT